MFILLLERNIGYSGSLILLYDTQLYISKWVVECIFRSESEENM